MPALDANGEMDTSDISDLDDKVTDTPILEPDAGSSPAKDETDADLLSVTRDVIDKTLEKSAAASSAEGEVKVTETEEDDEPKKPDDEDFSDVPFHKHPRFQTLLRKSKENEADAQRYRNVDQFLQAQGVDGEEAAEALIVAGLAKTNPAAAWERIKPWVQKILVASGEVLPADLNQRVQAGEMSHAVALEVSKARATQQSMTQAQQFEQSRRERDAQQSQVRAVMDAATNWENDRRIKDPNFADKETALRKEIAFLQREEGVPRSPQGVRAQLKKAYDAVNESFRPAANANPRPAVRPVTGGQVSGNQRSSAPKSTLEIIQQVTGR